MTLTMFAILVSSGVKPMLGASAILHTLIHSYTHDKSRVTIKTTVVGRRGKNGETSKSNAQNPKTSRATSFHPLRTTTFTPTLDPYSSPNHSINCASRALRGPSSKAYRSLGLR